jgi:hypothetical protein
MHTAPGTGTGGGQIEEEVVEEVIEEEVVEDEAEVVVEDEAELMLVEGEEDVDEEDVGGCVETSRLTFQPPRTPSVPENRSQMYRVHVPATRRPISGLKDEFANLSLQ